MLTLHHVRKPKTTTYPFFFPNYVYWTLDLEIGWCILQWTQFLIIIHSSNRRIRRPCVRISILKRDFEIGTSNSKIQNTVFLHSSQRIYRFSYNAKAGSWKQPYVFQLDNRDFEFESQAFENRFLMSVIVEKTQSNLESYVFFFEKRTKNQYSTHVWKHTKQV